jgi:hypothetical protein
VAFRWTLLLGSRSAESALVEHPPAGETHTALHFVRDAGLLPERVESDRLVHVPRAMGALGLVRHLVPTVAIGFFLWTLEPVKKL